MFVVDLKRYWEKMKYSVSSFYSNPNFSQHKNFYIYFTVLIIAGVALYFIGGYLNGLPLTAKITAVSSQLFQTQSQLDNATKQLQAAQNQSAYLQSQLNSAQSSLQNCQTTQQALQNNITYLQNSTSYLLDQLSTCNTGLSSYQSIVLNSIRAVCCSFADVQAGTVRNWQIFSNSIACSGSNTVNCGTGAVTQS